MIGSEILFSDVELSYNHVIKEPWITTTKRLFILGSRGEMRGLVREEVERRGDIESHLGTRFLY